MLDHACCLPHSAKQNGLRYVSFLFRRGSRSPFVRSRYVCMVICLWQVHFGFVRFFMAISTGLPGCGDAGTGNGAGGAAFVRFCAGALALESFRGEYAGAARPRLRQRVFDSLDSLHLIRGVGAFHAAKGTRV